jgi:hypothetical protein
MDGSLVSSNYNIIIATAICRRVIELYKQCASKEQEEEVEYHFMAFSYDTKNTYKGTEEGYSASPESNWDTSKYTSKNLLLQTIRFLLLYGMGWSSHQNNDESAW